MLKLEALNFFLQVQLRLVLFALRLLLNYFRCELSLIKKSIFLIRKTNKYEVKSTLFVHCEFKRKLKKHLNRMTGLDA